VRFSRARNFFLFEYWVWSPYWVHSALRPLLAYCICPGWLWEWRSWWYERFWKGKPKYSEKACPDATLSTTNPTCQTRARTRAAAVRSQWLTASAMARPSQKPALERSSLSGTWQCKITDGAMSDEYSRFTWSIWFPEKPNSSLPRIIKMCHSQMLMWKYCSSPYIEKPAWQRQHTASKNLTSSFKRFLIVAIWIVATYTCTSGIWSGYQHLWRTCCSRSQGRSE
jgi:hypothetical protein